MLCSSIGAPHGGFGNDVALGPLKKSSMLSSSISASHGGSGDDVALLAIVGYA